MDIIILILLLKETHLNLQDCKYLESKNMLRPIYFLRKAILARAYTDIAPKINQYKKFEFVWITDGQGWLSAKNKLGEAYSLIPSIYNLANLDDFLSTVKSEL